MLAFLYNGMQIFEAEPHIKIRNKSYTYNCSLYSENAMFYKLFSSTSFSILVTNSSIPSVDCALFL